MSITIRLPSGFNKTFDKNTLTIGSDPSCDVVIAQSHGVQPLHARLRKIGDRWLMESAGAWPCDLNDASKATKQWVAIGGTVGIGSGETLTLSIGATSAIPSQRYEPKAPQSASTPTRVSEPILATLSPHQNATTFHPIASPADWKENAALIAVSMICFFPVGLFLVWRHSTWSTLQKLAWTGGLAAFIAVGSIGSNKGRPDGKQTGVTHKETTHYRSRSQPEEAGKWGMIDTTGRQIATCRFSRIGVSDAKTWLMPDVRQLIEPRQLGDYPIPVELESEGQEGSRWGFIDRKGKTVIPFDFKNAMGFSNNLAAVQALDGMWGYLNTSGTWTIAPQYDEALAFAPNGLAAVRKGNNQRLKWGFISITGNEVISHQYTVVRTFVGNRACVSKGTPYADGSGARGGWGIIDEHGKQIVECNYFSIDQIESGFARVLDKKNVFDDKEDAATGIIDVNGTFTFPMQSRLFLDRLEPTSGGVLAHYYVPGTSGYIYPDGKLAINTDSPFAGPLGESLVPVQKGFDLEQMRRGLREETWGKYGFATRQGTVTIRHQFSHAQPFHEGLAAVSVKDEASDKEKWGFIDETGAFVVQPQFNKASSFSEGLAAVGVGELWGYIDRSGKFIVAPQYANVSQCGSGVAFVQTPK